MDLNGTCSSTLANHSIFPKEKRPFFLNRPLDRATVTARLSTCAAARAWEFQSQWDGERRAWKQDEAKHVLVAKIMTAVSAVEGCKDN